MSRKRKFTSLVELFSEPEVGTTYHVQGWVRSKRESAQVFFLVIGDGSTPQTLQAVGDPSTYKAELLQSCTTGAAVLLKGKLRATPERVQSFELQLEHIELVGAADPTDYPLQPKKHNLEFLRSIPHLRVRTATYASVFRVRHAASFAIHQFFHGEKFFHIHTPIIVSSDAEGAGEMFQVHARRGTTTEDFFSSSAYLTVSGQLHAELLAMGLSKVYTFGPTFRAENSQTTRHLAEFWMVEPEMAFFDLKECIQLAEKCLRTVFKYVLKHCEKDLEQLDAHRKKREEKLSQKERSSHTLIEELQHLAKKPYVTLTYCDAFKLLKESKPNRKGKFNYPVKEWGQDLQSEHERYLVKHYDTAVIVKDYPAQTKAFYMRINDNEQTVAAMDVLMPQVGELIGGSQREERLDKLQVRMSAQGIDEEEMNWYLDTRRFGSVRHSGFGLGFERLVQLLTGMENIRDVIPFPRTPGSLKI